MNIYDVLKQKGEPNALRGNVKLKRLLDLLNDDLESAHVIQRV